MALESKQEAYLKILGRIIGTLCMSPSKGQVSIDDIEGFILAPYNFEEVVKKSMQLAHEAMKESEQYSEDVIKAKKLENEQKELEKQEHLNKKNEFLDRLAKKLYMRTFKNRVELRKEIRSILNCRGDRAVELIYDMEDRGYGLDSNKLFVKLSKTNEPF